MPAQPWSCGGRPRRGCGRAAGRGRSRPRLPGRIRLALWPLPSDLIAISGKMENPAGKRGFLLSSRKAAGPQNKRSRKFPPLRFFNSPVAEATAAERSGMPAGRAVVHRTATAIRPAVPARSTAASHRNGRGAGRGRLIERSDGHGLRDRHRRKAEADREQGYGNNFHGHSFLLVRDENDLAKTL